MTATVTPEEWADAREALLKEEKALTRARDALAAKRRRMPRMEVTGSYRFRTPRGGAGLADLFEGRSQLVVYHHMLRPDDPSPCTGCCMFADGIGHLDHLHARDTSFTMVSKAPIGQIEAFRRRFTFRGLGLTLWKYQRAESAQKKSEDEADGDAGNVQAQPVAEVELSERTAMAMLDRGVMPLCSIRNQNAARLLRFQSIADPPTGL